ncbi:MAG: hypothetical protein KAR45_12350, partial [Desulfobacteraceae bacterium]|nr:hypothetical protein [Desulfobacteraceae bacterium]
NQGMHFPLHKGTEVLLTFIDGNPDRPVIAGAMPNPETSSPVTGKNQTKSLISTGKSPVDGSVGAGDLRARTNSSNDNYIEFEDADGSERIRIHSDGDLWTEAQDRYTEYKIGVPSTSEARPTHVADLIDKMYDHSSSGFGPEGMELYMDEEPYRNPDTSTSGADTTQFSDCTTDAEKWQYLVDKGKVTIAKGDTFNTLEGNMYDFGGYWNYNLGNSYAEDHLDQAAELNKTRNLDLLDDGGPGWIKVDWEKGLEQSTSAGSKIESGDIEIGSSDDWKATAATDTTNVWVSKQFGRSYSYSEVDSIDVNKGSSLDIQHGGKHVEVVFRGSTSGAGPIKSWAWQDGAHKKGKTWDSTGRLTSEMEYESGVLNEKAWNYFAQKDTTNPLPLLSQKTVNKNSGTTSVHTHCRDTGNIIAYNSTHQGFNSVHSFDFSWANTASMSFKFAAGAALNVSAVTSLEVNFAAGLCTEINLPIIIPLPTGAVGGLDTKITVDLNSLKIGIDLTGIEIKLMGIKLESKKNAVEATSKTGVVEVSKETIIAKLEKQGAVKVIDVSPVELQNAKLNLRKTGIDLTI